MTRGPSGEQALAGAVIRQAVLDARSRRRTEREAAAAFLASAALDFWAHVAGLPPETVRLLAGVMLTPLYVLFTM